LDQVEGLGFRVYGQGTRLLSSGSTSRCRSTALKHALVRAPWNQRKYGASLASTSARHGVQGGSALVPSDTSGFGVPGSGFRVSGLASGVWGSGFGGLGVLGFGV